MKLPPQSYPRIGLRPDLTEYLSSLLAGTISAWSETTTNHRIMPFRALNICVAHAHREAWVELPLVNPKAWPKHKEDDRNLYAMRLAYEHSAMAAGCKEEPTGWRHQGRTWRRGERILNTCGIDCDYNLMEEYTRELESIDTSMLNMMCSLSWEAKQGRSMKAKLHEWWQDGYRMDRLKDEPDGDDPAWIEIARLKISPLSATP